ncbi:hypothetical protein [Rhodophyticola porphyridii]|uniref:YMGG-like Gly-zipper domain-containing protein n=1 Tax=Rhodophyticola porphyridii TaxID=1852017 RepID=A0A3L9Y3H9_9RHOB|nr:hypothetical protein [Rhodophyticola porphyridii]RMA41647.1 hypothetical protein D9R08_12265 [Rhodophyticola porphyridii]
MRGIHKLTLALVATLGLSACVSSDLERAAVGAAVGGVGAAALGGSVATGIVVGGAVGAICDEVTNICR